MKLREIADALGCRLEGDGEIEISGVAGMEHAGPGQLTFLANPKYAPKVKHTKASAILVSRGACRAWTSPAWSRTNPYLDFARALALFYQPPRPAPGIHPLAYVAPTAAVGENCSIGPFAVVGEHVRIGRNAVLHPHVVIYEGAEIGDDFLAHSHAVVREFCRIGNRVILQNGVVVGGDGFGFAKRADGTHYKIVQSGVTVIEDDVEIQSLTSVDRATVGETRVKRGAKIDSLVQVGHACVVGEDNIICAQTGLAGSTVLERNVLLAGQVGVVRPPDDPRRRHRLRAERHRRRRGGGRAHLRLAGLRRQRMAARHHRVSQAAGNAEDRARIEEESRGTGEAMTNQTATSWRPPAGRLPERGVPEQPGCAGAAHPVRVSGAAGAFPPREDPRHGGVLRLGAHPRRRAAGAVLSRRARRWRACSPSGPSSSPTAPTVSWSARAAGRASWRRPIAARRRERQDHRAEHRPAVRAVPQSLHHAGAELRVPLLLHAQVLVRVSGEGAGGVSRAASARWTR